MIGSELRNPDRTPGNHEALSKKAIQAHLEHVLAHREFHATDKMREFLRFVVEETLAGRSHQLKGFTIATAVFGRDIDFDAAHDPVVRIQAGRLRRAIERYYLVGGVCDPIRIKIPKGTYVPVFSAWAVPESSETPRIPVTGPAVNESWPVVLVFPFQNISGNPDLDYIGYGLANELCTRLGEFLDLRVISFREGTYGKKAENTHARFTIEGTVQFSDSTVKIVTRLVESDTGEQLWSEVFKSPSGSVSLMEFQEQVALVVATHIAGEHGIIPRRLSAESGSKKTIDLTTYEAILKAYAYDQAPNPGSYQTAFKALQNAIKESPSCGLVSGRLALLYADNIALEFFDPGLTPLGHAIHLAQEAVLMEPNHQMNRIVLARVRLLNNELDAALLELDVALKLNPNSLQYMDAIGYLLMLLGQWERGEMLIRRAIQLNPFYRVVVHYGLWLNWFRQHQYLQALQELELVLGIGSFWDPLTRAATLARLGRIEEASHAAQDLLTLKPDFPQRADILIGHYVKFADIAEEIKEGLEMAGL